MEDKIYTGIILGYNTTTKVGLIMLDESSDSNQPNVIVFGNELPKDFIFTDSSLKTKKVEKEVKSKDKTKTIKILVDELEKDSNGKVIPVITKVSFHLNDKNEALKVTVL